MALRSAPPSHSESDTRGTTSNASTHSFTPPRLSAPTVRARRNPRLIIIGVLCVCLGGLGIGFAWQQASDSQQVVVMSHAIAKGQIVESADLSLTTIGSAPGLAAVPSSDIDRLVGQTALVDLPQGSLVTSQSIGEPAIAVGRSRVGLQLPPTRVPASLELGSKVVIATAPGPQDPTGTQVSLAQTPGIVVTPPIQTSDGGWSFDVEVDQEASLSLATFASAQRLVVVAEAGA